jgi:hypothetical protein
MLNSKNNTLKRIIYILLFVNFYVNCLKVKDICIKRVECNGKNYCKFSSCIGKLGYDCSRLECSRNEDLCNEYHGMLKYLDLKKNIKLENLKTLGSIRGVTFVTKNLRMFEKLKKNIRECS